MDSLSSQKFENDDLPNGNKELINDILGSLDVGANENSDKASVSDFQQLDLINMEIDPDAISAVPSKVVLHYKFMPIEISDRGLKIAVTNLNDVRLLDDLRTFLGYDVLPFLAKEDDILEMVNKHYGTGNATIEEIVEETLGEAKKKESEGGSFTEIIDNNDDETSVVKFVNKIFSEAFHAHATDIHIEPYEDKLRVRFRIDGELIRLNVPGELINLKASILSRIKIMARLDIAEHRFPQDGRIKVKINDIFLDMRVSTLPTTYGEAVNIRLLSRNISLDMLDLGFDENAVNIISSVIAKPHGLVVVTGPTGSGKSSTLYTSLNKLNTDNRKIITLEDPIEYNIEGITQMQTKDKIGFNFAAGLRSILRHDPDVIMVGEVRDLETAEISIQAALTGHLVFTTLHTNSASQTIMRLIDLGIEPFLLADAIECAIAQRLIRVLCSSCKQEIAIDDEYKTRYLRRLPELVFPKTVFAASPGGCSLCNETGYSGRTVIYEIIPFDKELKNMVHAGAGADAIEKYAFSLGAESMLSCALKKVFSGTTSFEEIVKVTG